MMKKLLVLNIIILNFLTVYSQNNKQIINGGFGYYKHQFGFMNFDALNDAIPNRFPSVQSNFQTLGGGGYFVYKNFMLGGNGGAIYQANNQAAPNNNNNLDYNLSGGFGSFNLGYMLNFKRIFMYPSLGIGGQTFTFNYYEYTTPNTFDDVVNNQTQNFTLSADALAFNFELNALYFFAQNEDGKGGFMLGLCGGYVLPAYNSDWYFEDGSSSGIALEGGPKFNSSHFYFGLKIGGGFLGTNK